MRNGFDLLAPVYDQLAGVIFGRSIKHAQCAYLNKITGGSDILILGGGTGWIVHEILARQGSVFIYFVDSSEGMLKMAKESLPLHLRERVKFFKSERDQVVQAQKFDVVITPFFLDMFSDDEVLGIIGKMKERLHDDGMWLFTDFVNSFKIHHNLLLKIMYWFFGTLCKISANGLADMDNCFAKGAMHKIESQYFYGGMIESTVYKKSK